MHWVTDNNGAVQSKATDAAPSAPPFTTTVDPQAIAKSLAVDDEFVYWTVYMNSEGKGEVRRAHLGMGDTVTLGDRACRTSSRSPSTADPFTGTVNDLEAEETAVVFQMPKPSN